MVRDSVLQLLPRVGAVLSVLHEGNAHDQFAETIAAGFGKDGEGRRGDEQ
jgi:hypothetical protein